jgi:hypothetical protein
MSTEPDGFYFGKRNASLQDHVGNGCISEFGPYDLFLSN